MYSLRLHLIATKNSGGIIVKENMFDLDVQVLKGRTDAEPAVKSKAFCTPGCVEQTLKTSCCLKCKTSLCNSNMSCW